MIVLAEECEKAKGEYVFALEKLSSPAVILVAMSMQKRQDGTTMHTS